MTALLDLTQTANLSLSLKISGSQWTRSLAGPVLVRSTLSLHCQREHLLLRKSRVCKLSRSNTSDIACRKIASLVPSPGIKGLKGQMVILLFHEEGKGR